MLFSPCTESQTRKRAKTTVKHTICFLIDPTSKVLKAINLDEVQMKGYGFQIEMKYTAYRLGFKIAEVPIIFINRKEGTSKMSSGIFGEAFWGVLKLRFRKFSPRG